MILPNNLFFCCLMGFQPKFQEEILSEELHSSKYLVYIRRTQEVELKRMFQPLPITLSTVVLVVST